MKAKINHIATFALALLWQSTALMAAEPQDLTILRDSYQRALERATSPIHEKFITEMQKLKLRYTKEGKLEEAIVVDKEITKLLGETKPTPDNKGGKDAAGAAGVPEHLIGEWSCNNVLHDIYKIKPNKRAQHLADNGTWKANEQELTISWENGWRTVIDINQTGDNLNVKSYPPGASDYIVIKFTRIIEDEE